MGLQSAMTTALTGLQAAETTIDVVGNNVANSSTVGFKESSAVFATQFLQTQSIGSAPSDTQGGTNPRQVGLGVNVASITPDFTQGTIEISSNPLDVAIQGDTIVEVGEVGGHGSREIDAMGAVVSPGFIDLHTHFDAQIGWDPQLTPASWHGVTTALMGNCGVTFAPVRSNLLTNSLRLFSQIWEILQSGQ